MSEYFSKVSEKVQNHLKQLAGTVSLPQGSEEADGLELLAQAWLEKEEIFQREAEKNDFEFAQELPEGEDRGALVMTYSGSLLSLGPQGEGGRRVEYSSIGMRTDVPDTLEQEGARLEGGIVLDEPVKFADGPLKKSSPVFKLVLINENLSDQEAEDLLSEMTQMLTDEFVEVNKTLIM